MTPINVERFDAVVKMFREALQRALDADVCYTGSIGIKLHVQEGVIRKPEITGVTFPKL